MPDDVPDRRRALLAVAAALALVASAAAAPALGGQAPLGGLDSPASADDLPRALSQFDVVRDLVGEAPQSAGGLEVPGGETFGALDPGDSTDVGGPVSEEQLEGAAQPHFLASSDRPQYWRTAAYVTYTGGGWERAPVNTVGPPRPESERDRNWHEVTLRQPASSLPAPWRPVSMSERPVGVGYNCTDGETCDVDFVPTDTGGITAEPPLPAGETYRVESLDPVDDTSALRDIRVSGSFASTQYSTVDTTDRVEQLAERVVGDADNRYDAAKAIETYLEAEKEYSLRDAPETGDSAADEFLFEHDVGYCENYATTMTVMLRSQGVPARYVAGYTSGEQVGDGQYLVRGADAHAWVEVFFEDYGWVRFDPTPSAPRQQADSDLAAGTDTYEVRVDQTLVPGDSVNATVVSAGTPVSGAAVSVNDEFVGRTDDAGAVQFTVPYAESVNVTVEPPSSDAPGDTDESTAGGFGTAGVLAQQTGAGDDDDDQPRNGSTSREFDVNAAVDVAFDEPPQPGETTTAQLFVGGQPFPNATVALGGDEQGRTDANGELAVSVPEDAAGVVDVTASRDDLSATVSYPLDDLQVAVSPAYLAPLPGTDATVTVTAGGETVTGATVELNGDRLGVTGEAGTVSATVPFTRTPSVTATASGKTTTGYVDWVLPSLALAVFAAAGVVAGAAVALRHRGLTVGRVAAALRYAAREVVAAAVEAISGVADAVDDLVAEFRAAAADGWRESLSWLAGLPSRLRLPDVAGFVRRVAAAARAGSREASASPDGDQSRGALQRVWARFVALVGVDDWETRTPVEVARAAVDAGLPREPVERVTESFRAAAYGGGDTESAVAEASEALDALTDRAGDDEDEEGSRQ